MKKFFKKYEEMSWVGIVSIVFVFVFMVFDTLGTYVEYETALARLFFLLVLLAFSFFTIIYLAARFIFDKDNKISLQQAIKWAISVTAFSLLMLLISSATAKEHNFIEATVIKVIDGDTITVLAQSGKIKVRLAEIDAPEKDQPYGLVAKNKLQEKILDKNITLQKKTIDRYGRLVAKVFLDKRDIIKEMIAEGHVWVYKKYLDDYTLDDIQMSAHQNQIGIWSLINEEQVPPWEWRQSKRKKN
jgi:endonuclease YncB( thermonuclease family)